MTSPRQLLGGLSFALVTIGVQTFRYPPEFLALAYLWCGVAILAGLSCAAAAIRPRRIYVALSGATIVTSSAARGFALVIEWLHASNTREAGFVVGALTWWMVALLAYIVWREYVLPWSLGRDRPAP